MISVPRLPFAPFPFSPFLLVSARFRQTIRFPKLFQRSLRVRDSARKPSLNADPLEVIDP